LRNKVLIITGDPIGAKLAGPAIRAWNMAAQLAARHEVRLLSLTAVEDVSAPFESVHVPPFENASFQPHHDWADVIIFQGHAMLVLGAMRSSEKILVVDIYDPMHLEQLEQARELPRSDWITQVRDATAVLNDQLLRGDFFVCASERQRLFWLGQLAALGRLNPLTYENDPDLLRLIDIAPFGLSRTPARHEKAVLKGVHPGIGLDDKLLLWSGGLYNWFDSETLITAVAELVKTRPNVRLFFQGTKHPHPGVPEMEIVSKSRSLAKQLGVLDTAVFFNDSWVDFDERQNYLTEADLGVSTHHSHIETTFSFRTRILDYLWAELPMVVTEGDHFSDLVTKDALGISVPATNVTALRDALEKALFDEQFIRQAKKNIRKTRELYFWDVVLAPLTHFVDTATRSADRGLMLVGGVTQGELPAGAKQPSKLSRDLRLALGHLRNGGVKKVAERVITRLNRN
jgi:glycosyltransferase involved in cell wall biosynthesis